MKYNANHQQFEQIGTNYDYFKSDLLPQLPSVRKKKITESTQMAQNDYVEIIYTEKGKGTIIVNGVKHDLIHGFCCVLFFYNFHQIIPDPETPLDIVSITLDYRTFLYIYTMFHDYAHWMELSQEFVMAYMSGKNQKICEKIIQKICSTKKEGFWDKLVITNGITELYARIMRKSLN